MKYFFTAALLGVLVFSSCNNNKSPKKEVTEKEATENEVKENAPSKTAHYTITAPEGWTKTDTFLLGKNFTILKSPPEAGDNFMENMNVITENVGETDLDAYVKKNVSSLEVQLNEFKLEKTSDRSINGVPFRFLKYSHVYSNIPMDGEAYLGIKDGIAYVITCSTNGGAMEKWEPAFEEAIGTFKID